MQDCTIAAFDALVHPRDAHGKIFVMLEAYVDESGIHGGAHALVVAGFWGSRGPWSKFERAWRSALRSHGFVLEQFHARNLLNRCPPFEQLDEKDFGSLQDKLLRAIEKAQIHPFAVGIVVGDFRGFSVEERRWLTGAPLSDIRKAGAGKPELPYFVPFHWVLDRVCAQHVPSGQKAHFFWGIDRQIHRYAGEVFGNIHAQEKPRQAPTWRERLGSTAAPLAAQTPHLQAADLLAYATWFDVEDMVKRGEPRLEIGGGRFGYLRRRILKNNRGGAEFSIMRKAFLQDLAEPATREITTSSHAAASGT
jgi:hypothetical protein